MITIRQEQGGPKKTRYILFKRGDPFPLAPSHLGTLDPNRGARLRG